MPRTKLDDIGPLGSSSKDDVLKAEQIKDAVPLASSADLKVMLEFSTAT
jgi:hypothetical protein